MSTTTNNGQKNVVLEHLTLPDRGRRFWTTNSDNNTHGYNGELWYKEVAFTDSDDEAIRIAMKTNYDAVPSSDELMKYWDEKFTAGEADPMEAFMHTNNNMLAELINIFGLPETEKV